MVTLCSNITWNKGIACCKGTKGIGEYYNNSTTRIILLAAPGYLSLKLGMLYENSNLVPSANLCVVYLLAKIRGQRTSTRSSLTTDCLRPIIHQYEPIVCNLYLVSH